MRIILLEQFNNLGSLGDIIFVKNGFARNFLIPKGIASLATKKIISKLKLKKKKIKKIFKKKIFNLKKKAKKINNLIINIYKKTSSQDRLFASVNKTEILNKLKKKNIFIEKNEIKLSHGFIKTLGKFKIPICLSNNINSYLLIFVLKI